MIKKLLSFAFSFTIAVCISSDAAPTSQPTTKDSPKPPSKVIFVGDARGRMIASWANGFAPGEIEKAVAGLDKDQQFNIIVVRDGKVELLNKTLLHSGQKSPAEIRDFLAPGGVGAGDLDGAIVAAISFTPDVIWLATSGDMEVESRQAIIRKSKAAHTRINTVTAFSANGDPESLWLIAHETGGVCLDEHGKDVPEPRPTNAPATGPSIFKNR